MTTEILNTETIVPETLVTSTDPAKLGTSPDPAKLGTFQDWSQIDCSICSEPIRQLCTESPLNFNEHTNLNIIVLPCKHYYHYSCINEWLKHEAACPYCRASSQAQSLEKMVYPPVRCRASILREGKNKKDSRVGKQCECLEYPVNMGFCRKHLPPLDELTSKSGHIIDLGNRKFLTILKYQHLNAFPSDIKKELLIKAHKIIKDQVSENKTYNQLLKEVTPQMTI